MSYPPNGNYFLVNKTTTSDGTLLAVTFNGVANPLIVTEFDNLDTQVWTLATYGAGPTQVISPLNNSSLVVGTDGTNYVLKALQSSGRHNWTIKGTLGIYTIEDLSGLGNRWFIKNAVEGEDMVKGTSTSNVEWLLVLA
ncbi:hypothetical protein HD554DRAFT_2108490 [Boletus coccyginus]|nr:hypothetical protein HD554DRAFT_2108490 [Boletus coccyginus]